MTKKNEVTVVKDDPNALPDYLVAGGYKNEDNFGADDVVIPRIKLLQGTSDEITTYDDAKIGSFWHSGADINLGESFKFVVCDRRRKYLLMAPINDGQGILARAEDAKTWDRLGSWSVKHKGQKNPVTWEITDLDVEKSGLAGWGTSIPDDEDSPPAATLFYDYLVILPDFPDLGPSVMSLARTAIKPAKKDLNSKIKTHGDNGRPMQALLFEASSFDDSADGQDFKNWKFRGAGFVQSKEDFEMYRSYVGALGRLKVQDEAGAAGDDAKVVDDGEGKF